MFKQNDEQFKNIVSDASRRQSTIADFKIRRTIGFWASIMGTIAFVLSAFNGKSSAMVAAAFLAALCWAIFLKIDSDLRLFSAIDLSQDSKNGSRMR